jgi:hypothetical protein
MKIFGTPGTTGTFGTKDRKAMERFELNQELGRELLELAMKKGASAGDAVMVESESFSVTVRMGVVEKISLAG